MKKNLFNYIVGIGLFLVMICLPGTTVTAQEEVRDVLHNDEIGIDLRAFFENQVEQMDKE